MTYNFNPFPVLKTKRLILRKLQFNDVKEVFFLRTNQKVNAFITRKVPKEISEAEDFIKTIHHLVAKNEGVFWVISLKENNKLIGSIGLRNFIITENYAEIGYELNPNYQQKGFMSEALQKVVTFGFQELNLKTIEAFTHKNNLASIALLKKHQFILQQERRDKDFDANRIWKLEKKKDC